MTATPRNTNYAGLALAHVFALSEPAPLPPPPALPAPPAQGSSVHFSEAADAAREVLRQAEKTLAATLKPEQQAYLTVLIQAARQLGTCQERAHVRRKAQADLRGSVEGRLRHVALRMNQRFGWEVTVAQLQDLQHVWRAGPAEQAIPGCIVRRVTFRDRMIYPLYEVLPTGAQYLTTVLKEPPLD